MARTLFRSPLGKGCEPMEISEITPLYVGVSGYIAEVCRQLEIAKMVNHMVSWDETQCKLSPGALTVALVINILTQRRPLYRVWESFERLDLPVLFDEPVTLDSLNDDAFGRTLDRLHASGNLRRLIHSVALRATRLLPLGIRSIHADTTSISVAGEYELTASDRAFLEEHPDGSVLDIRHGYSKDRRPDLKQFIYGLVVSGEGLPLLGTVQDGNTSDKVWNSQIIDEIQQSFLDPQNVIYVADSALITPTNLDKMAQHKMRFISRLPETYHLAQELKDRAWSRGRWEAIGRLAQSEKGAVYRAQSFEETLEGRTYRFIVVHSSSLDQRKLKAIQKEIDRERAELEKAQKQWHKQTFQCREDAASALTAILKEHEDAYHTITGEVVEEQVIHRPPGRPPKNFVPETTTQFRIQTQLVEPTEQRIHEAHAKASTFVLITSLLDQDRWNNYDILQEYKGQISIETRFRNLKADPCIVDNIYVKSSRRAEALAYLFLLALIVAAYIEIKIRQELKVRRQQFVVPGNRLTDRPTMTSIFDIMQTVLVVLVHTPEGVQRILPTNTDPRVYQILELTGLDQTAYTGKR